MSIVHIAFYPSDWLAGTRGLSAEETGVYITLISKVYEMAGPIERDDNRLTRLCGCTSKAKFVKALEYLISEGKMVERDGYVTNERAEKEIKIVTEKSGKAKAAAQSRWDRKPSKNNGGDDANASTEHMPEACQSEPEPEEPKGSKKITKKTPTKSELEKWFDIFWQAYPRKVNKGKAEEKFRAVMRTASFDEVMDGVGAYATAMHGRDKNYIAHAASWLNGKRWLDEVGDIAPSTTPQGQPQEDSIYTRILEQHGHFS